MYVRRCVCTDCMHAHMFGCMYVCNTCMFVYVGMYVHGNKLIYIRIGGYHLYTYVCTISKFMSVRIHVYMYVYVHVYA